MIMSELDIQQLSTSSDSFWSELDELLAWESVSDDKVNNIVRDIIARVRSEGDQAVIEFTNQFDRMQAKSMDDLTFSQTDLDAAASKIDKQAYQALEQAADRVRPL